MAFTYLNGRLVGDDEAKVAAFDLGLQLGVGLFETMRTYSGRFFRLAEHVDRLLASAAALKVPMGLDRRQLIEAAAMTVERNGLSDARVRITVTPGRKGSEAAGSVPTTLVTAVPLEAYPDDLYKAGMTTVVADVRQNETDPTARHKTLQYFTRLVALEEARRKGAAEALFFNTEKRLACGAISNVFLVEATGTLSTPSLETGILPGITRKAVLDLAGEAGMAVGEKTLFIQDLLSAREVFLTNSIMEVMPVVKVERHTVGDGSPGPVTRKLGEMYKKAVG
jgi:D-amino acid aminotransferase